MNPDAEVDDDFTISSATDVITDVSNSIVNTITDIKKATDAIKTAAGGNKAVPPVANNNALSTNQMIMIALGVIVLAYGAKKLLA